MTSLTGTPSAYVRSAIDPFSDEFLADPFPPLEEIRNAGPVVYLERYGIFAVARHEQVSSVLRNPQAFSSSCGLQRTSSMPIRRIGGVDLPSRQRK